MGETMLLTNLKLENIRSYRNLDINFPGGIVFFEGEVGAGKSTILYAVEFALFGLSDVGAQDMLRHGEKKSFVELTIDVYKAEYRMFRSIEKDHKGTISQKCWIEHGGIRTDYRPTEMKREILKILNFNEPESPKASSVIYRYAVFTPQEEMKSILRQGEEERIKTFRKIFGIEEYSIAKENTKLIVGKIKEKESLLDGATRDADVKINELKNKEIEFSKLAEFVEKLDKEISALKVNVNNLEKKNSEYEKFKKEIDILGKEINDYQLKINQLDYVRNETEKNLKEILESEIKLKEIEPKIKELSRLEKTLRENECQYEKKEEIRNEIKIKNEKIEGVQEQLKGLLEIVKNHPLFLKKKNEFEKECVELPNIERELSKMSDTKSKLEEKIRIEEENVRNIEGELEAFKSLKTKAKCPKCKQPLTAQHIRKLLQENTKKHTKLKGDIKNFTQECDDISKEIRKLGSQKEKLSAIRIELVKLEAELARIDKAEIDLHETAIKLEELNKERAEDIEKYKKMEVEKKDIEKLKNEIRALEPIKTNYNVLTQKVSEKDRVEKTRNRNIVAMENASKIWAEKNEVLKKLKERYDEGEYNKVRDEYTKKNTALGRAEGELNARKESVTAIKQDVERLKMEIEGKKKQILEKERLTHIRFWLDDYFSNALDAIETQILSNINEDFDMHFQKWFGMLMNAQEISGRINMNFTPEIEQNGYKTEFESLSGGEKTAVALAYRLALNILLRKEYRLNESSLLVLDEPTDGFSRDQLYRVGEVLNELNCTQTIIVSHEKELESFAQKIFRVIKSDGMSRVE